MLTVSLRQRVSRSFQSVPLCRLPSGVEQGQQHMPRRPQDSTRRVIWAKRISHAHRRCAGTRLWATHWLTVVHGGRHSGAEPRDRESEIIVLAVCGMVDSLQQKTRRMLERRTEPIRMQVGAVKICVRTKMYREGRCWSIGCRKSSWRIGNRIAKLECVLQTDALR